MSQRKLKLFTPYEHIYPKTMQMIIAQKYIIINYWLWSHPATFQGRCGVAWCDSARGRWPVARRNQLLIWLNENAGFAFFLLARHNPNKFGFCSRCSIACFCSRLTKTFLWARFWNGFRWWQKAGYNCLYNFRKKKINWKFELKNGRK